MTWEYSEDNLIEQTDIGSISPDVAIDKATTEYKKYQQKTLSEVEKSFLESLKTIENKSKKDLS